MRSSYFETLELYIHPLEDFLYSLRYMRSSYFETFSNGLRMFLKGFTPLYAE